MAFQNEETSVVTLSFAKAQAELKKRSKRFNVDNPGRNFNSDGSSRKSSSGGGSIVPQELLDLVGSGGFASLADVANAQAAAEAAAVAADAAAATAQAAVDAAQDAAAAAEEAQDAVQEAQTDAEQAVQDTDISDNAADIAGLQTTIVALQNALTTLDGVLSAHIAAHQVRHLTFDAADFVGSDPAVLTIPAAVHNLPYMPGEVYDITVTDDTGCEIGVQKMTNLITGDITITTTGPSFDGIIRIE